MAPKVIFLEPKAKPNRAVQDLDLESRLGHPNPWPWLISQNLTFWNPKGNFTEPSKWWTRLQGLAIQISGLSLWPKVNFLELEQEVSPSLTILGREFKAWQSKSMVLAYGPEVNFLKPEEETSPSFLSLGKESKNWQSKSMASVVGPKVNFLEPERKPIRAFQILERNSWAGHQNIWL